MIVILPFPSFSYLLERLWSISMNRFIAKYTDFLLEVGTRQQLALILGLPFTFIFKHVNIMGYTCPCSFYDYKHLMLVVLLKDLSWGTNIYCSIWTICKYYYSLNIHIMTPTIFNQTNNPNHIGSETFNPWGFIMRTRSIFH